MAIQYQNRKENIVKGRSEKCERKVIELIREYISSTSNLEYLIKRVIKISERKVSNMETK